MGFVVSVRHHELDEIEHSFVTNWFFLIFYFKSEMDNFLGTDKSIF